MTTTTPAALRAAAERFGDGEAVADGSVRLSWRELLTAAETVARALIAEGLEPGDRVALCAPNTHHWVAAVLGAQYAGCVAVPINTRFTGPEMTEILTRSRARALFVVGTFLGVNRLSRVRAALDGMTVIRIPGEGDRPSPDVIEWDALDAVAERVPVEVARARAGTVTPDQISDILFTSGTTGHSKGAITAHRQALGVAAAWVECGEVTSADRYLIVNPFFHSFGYKAGILAALLSGATIVPQAVFDLDRTLELVERERITVLPGPPTIYQTMLDRPGTRPSTLRLAVTGAAPVPVVLVQRMRSELSFQTVLTAYGLTEAVVVTMCRPGDAPEIVSRTSGRAVAGFEVRVAEDTREILVRGPNVMLGYLDDPEATAQAVDAEGWLHTGDIGVLDADGYLTITDRLKDMYVCGGFNVYPVEVEQVLARLPGVSECAVVGVPHERLGEVGRAHIILSPGAALSTEDVLAHCAERLANYKIPRSVEFRTDLPRNATGKILKRMLRDT
ncbi:FadD3 family acyl-CoA ligase [Actinokineospora xionganensis]|uniref:AMP-binding protein n=1 Tax=Actinokineospora xionganensis TaxID=2684470 RepID=A0ABR7L784_9PSEU|nr:FadD3 family acyl-CoA ligase [Actinokineospora xionganensis]MBC6448264.1 AMP-binding protein [Actinokineospora xionganensis]